MFSCFVVGENSDLSDSGPETVKRSSEFVHVFVYFSHGNLNMKAVLYRKWQKMSDISRACNLLLHFVIMRYTSFILYVVFGTWTT